jgi:hypothetical protein
VEAAGSQTQHAGSDVDAMGQDKRRQVVGQGYGPSKGRQLLYYGLFILLLIGLYIGAKIAVDELDKAPESVANQAPWSQQDAPQVPTRRFQ